MVPEGVGVWVLGWYGKGDFMVAWRDCVEGQMVSCSRVLLGMCKCNFWIVWIFHLQELATVNHNAQCKSVAFLFWGQDRIADTLTGDQLLGLWVWFCLVVLITPSVVTSFHPSAEQSVFVNWAAGALIASSVWLHRSVSCSLYFLDMLPWRWKLTLMPSRKIWCFIRSTSRSMTMSGKRSRLSLSCWGGWTLPKLCTYGPGMKMTAAHDPK